MQVFNRGDRSYYQKRTPIFITKKEKYCTSPMPRIPSQSPVSARLRYAPTLGLSDRCTLHESSCLVQKNLRFFALEVCFFLYPKHCLWRLGLKVGPVSCGSCFDKWKESGRAAAPTGISPAPLRPRVNTNGTTVTAENQAPGSAAARDARLCNCGLAASLWPVDGQWPLLPASTPSKVPGAAIRRFHRLGQAPRHTRSRPCCSPA